MVTWYTTLTSYMCVFVVDVHERMCVCVCNMCDGNIFSIMWLGHRHCPHWRGGLKSLK